MRKIAIVGALVLVTLGIGSPASGHGPCVAHSAALQVSTQPSVVAGGNGDCNGAVHLLTVSIGIWARPGGGGTWNRIAYNPGTTDTTNFKSVGVIYNGYNCAKDYRSLTSLAATSAGGSHSDSDYSPIYENRC